MADMVSPKSTHLVHYFYSLGPGQMSHGCSAYTLPAGWTPANYEWVLSNLTSTVGVTPVVTGVTPFDRPTINPDALRKALSDLADTLDAGASPDAVAAGLRQMVRVIK